MKVSLPLQEWENNGVIPREIQPDQLCADLRTPTTLWTYGVNLPHCRWGEWSPEKLRASLVAVWRQGSGTTSPCARLSPSSQSYLSCHLSSWPLTHELFEGGCGRDGARHPIVRKRAINGSHPLRSVTKELKRRTREYSGQVGDGARPASLRRPCWPRTGSWWGASWEVAEGKL